MELNIIVTLMDGNLGYDKFQIGLNIAHPFTKAYEPMRTTDDPIIAMATGEMMNHSVAVSDKLKLREDYAKILSEKLTEGLLETMKKRDTFNGYLIDKDER